MPVSLANCIRTILCLTACAFLSSSTTFALDQSLENDTPSRYFYIRQQILSAKGVLISKPNSLDKFIADFIYQNSLYSLVDYAHWLKNNVQYQADAPEDRITYPEEILDIKRGDCEDFALLNSAVSRVMGYRPRFMALVRKGKGHAICAFKKDGRYVWFDNNKLIVTDMKSLAEFTGYLVQRFKRHQLLELDIDTNTWRTLSDRM